MLTNFQIIDLAKKLNLCLIAVCSKDELNKVVPKVGGYVINLLDTNKGNGSQWTSFLIYKLQIKNIMSCIMIHME